MNWKFAGKSFDWRGEPDQLLSVGFDWHFPVSRMGAGMPDFEIEEMRSIISKPLNIRWQVGDLNAATDEVKAELRANRIEFVEVGPGWIDVAKEFRCVVSVSNNNVEVNVFLEKKELDGMIEDFKDYSSVQGLKCFIGDWQTRLLYGPSVITIQPDIKKLFLNGNLPALAT